MVALRAYGGGQMWTGTLLCSLTPTATPTKDDGPQSFEEIRQWATNVNVCCLLRTPRRVGGRLLRALLF